MEKKKKHKILFISEANDGIGNGAFRSLATLATLLRDDFDYEVIVVLPYKGTGTALLEIAGIESVIIPSYRWTRKIDAKINPVVIFKDIAKFGLNVLASLRISSLIKSRNIDVVHINSTVTCIGAHSALWTHKALLWHAREFLEEDWNTHIVFRRQAYALLKKASCFIAISKGIYNKYLPIMGPDKIALIYNGIVPDKYYQPDHDILKNDKIILLMVAHLIEAKKQDLAISACSILKERGITNFRLRLVGSGNEEWINHLNEIISEFHLEEYVEFCGTTDNTPEFYRTSDIFLMCSRAEAFGRVTVEAMMSGCLAIGSRSGGTADLINDGKTGYLFESGNAEELCDRIEYAITHKEESRRLANAGREYMINNMTARRNAEQVDALYRKILRGGQQLSHSLIYVSDAPVLLFAAGGETIEGGVMRHAA